MAFELTDVRRVLEAFEASDWDEIHLRADGLELRIDTAAQAGGTSQRDTVASGATTAADLGGTQPTAAADPGARPDAAPSTVAEGATGPPGGSSITAPSLGIFWRSPLPGAPPFVDVGQTVEPDTTMCIIEVMKLMNHVKAGVHGEVVAVLADNGQTVEPGQPLFTVVTN